MTAVAHDLVIFDLDGTLADTGADIAAAMTRALEGLGLPAPPPRRIVEAVGWGAEVLSRKVLSPEHRSRAPEVFARFREDYRAQLVVETRLYPGIRALLEELRGAGVTLGVATNKPAALSTELLHQLGLTPLLDHVVGPEDVEHRKPAPDALQLLCRRAGVPARRAAMVGDMETDVDAARAAGVRAVLVVWSDFFRGDDLADRADVVLDSVDALRAQLLPGLTDPGSGG